MSFKNTFFRSLIFLFSIILVNEFSRVVGGLGCVGKKTALLQAEASACVSGLANVQFCAWAVHYIIFLFIVFLQQNTAVVGFSSLVPNVFGLCVRAGFGAQSFNLLLKFIRSTKLQVCTSPRLTQNLCYRAFFFYDTQSLYSFVIVQIPFTFSTTINIPNPQSPEQ